MFIIYAVSEVLNEIFNYATLKQSLADRNCSMRLVGDHIEIPIYQFFFNTLGTYIGWISHDYPYSNIDVIYKTNDTVVSECRIRNMTVVYTTSDFNTITSTVSNGESEVVQTLTVSKVILEKLKIAIGLFRRICSIYGKAYLDTIPNEIRPCIERELKNLVPFSALLADCCTAFISCNVTTNINGVDYNNLNFDNEEELSKYFRRYYAPCEATAILTYLKINE